MENKKKAIKRELTKLEKRYKRLRWTQHVLFWISIIAAIVPALIVTFKVGALYKVSTGIKWRLAGYAIFVVAIGFILIAKGLISKLRDKLPWAITAVVGTWIMTGFIAAIKSIIEDAFIISFALAIGCTTAAVLSAVSDLCKAQADTLRDEYNRRRE